MFDEENVDAEPPKKAKGSQKRSSINAQTQLPKGGLSLDLGSGDDAEGTALPWPLFRIEPSLTYQRSEV